MAPRGCCRCLRALGLAMHRRWSGSAPIGCVPHLGHKPVSAAGKRHRPFAILGIERHHHIPAALRPVGIIGDYDRAGVALRDRRAALRLQAYGEQSRGRSLGEAGFRNEALGRRAPLLFRRSLLGHFRGVDRGATLCVTQLGRRCERQYGAKCKQGGDLFRGLHGARINPKPRRGIPLASPTKVRSSSPKSCAGKFPSARGAVAALLEVQVQLLRPSFSSHISHHVPHVHSCPLNDWRSTTLPPGERRSSHWGYAARVSPTVEMSSPPACLNIFLARVDHSLLSA